MSGLSSAFSVDGKNWAMELGQCSLPPGAPRVTMDGAAGAAPDEFSLGRKGHDLVLALICCVAFSKSLSFSEPLVKRWAEVPFCSAHSRNHPTLVFLCRLSKQMSSCGVLLGTY